MAIGHYFFGTADNKSFVVDIVSGSAQSAESLSS